jgi:GTPase involved in cell partitioning and DNA repair
MMLGQAREKFAQIAGPQGGSSLNGAALKSEAQAEMDKLMEDLKTGVTTQGWGWITG